MGTTTGITWCDATWNPFIGCHKVSTGCKNCYMFRDQKRYGNDPNVVRRASTTTFNSPLSWKKNGKVKSGSKIFTCSWSDWFIEEADDWRDDAWSIVKNTPDFIYLILTKRTENIKDRLPDDWGDGYKNVWLGATVESQKYLYRLEHLSDIKAAIRFVSYEPAIEEVSFRDYHPVIDWVISGGESDQSDPRPADVQWFRNVRDECVEDGIAFFHKQNGGKTKGHGGVWGGDEIDGHTWSQFPFANNRDLMSQEQEEEFYKLEHWNAGTPIRG